MFASYSIPYESVFTELINCKTKYKNQCAIKLEYSGFLMFKVLLGIQVCSLTFFLESVTLGLKFWVFFWWCWVWGWLVYLQWSAVALLSRFIYFVINRILFYWSTYMVSFFVLNYEYDGFLQAPSPMLGNVMITIGQIVQSVQVRKIVFCLYVFLSSTFLIELVYLTYFRWLSKNFCFLKYGFVVFNHIVNNIGLFLSDVSVVSFVYVTFSIMFTHFSLSVMREYSDLFFLLWPSLYFFSCQV